jgi:hypothetical protein
VEVSALEGCVEQQQQPQQQQAGLGSSCVGVQGQDVGAQHTLLERFLSSSSITPKPNMRRLRIVKNIVARFQNGIKNAMNFDHHRILF